ncbi:MAG: hypothetical protein KDD46_01545, partial [Bdellovibrionales bacterium]|nr:hypothetical protein [Bdellovibrionales bacterium]
LALSGTATGSGTDYTASSSSILITAGNTTGTITVTADQDLLDENDETVIVDIDSVTNATESGVQQQTTTITDDDTAPIVEFTSASQSTGVESGAFTITAQLDTVSGLDVTVPYTINGFSTAVDPSDYTITASPVVITAGNLTVDITITITADGLDESDETVIVDMGVPTNATAGIVTSHTLTINDDDVSPTVVIGAPTPTLINTGDVDYPVTYTNADTINLTTGDINVTTTGTVTYTVSVTDGTTTTPTITINVTGGNGTITQISIDAGTSTNNGGVNSDAGDTETTVVTVDNVAPTISINTPMTDISSSNEGNYSFNGTCSEDGATITVTAPASIAGATTTCSGGTWSFTAQNVSAESDGVVNFTVEIEDAATNVGSDTESANKDATDPTITIAPLTIINNTNASNYSFGGSCTDNGDTITITAPASIAGGTTSCAGGLWNFSSQNVSAESDGLGGSGVTFSVSIADTFGNNDSASSQVDKDTVAPTNPTCSTITRVATPQQSDEQAWTGSTDALSGIDHYEVALGSAGIDDIESWASIGAVVVSPYQYTYGSDTLEWNTNYAFSFRVYDVAGNVSSIVTCNTWQLLEPYGVFNGTQSTAGTNPGNLNQATAYALRYSSSKFHSSYFNHSTSTNSQNITIQYDGDYYISNNIPLTKNNGNTTTNAAAIRSTIKVNGVNINRGRAANGFSRGRVGVLTNTPIYGSNHIGTLLEGLSSGDVVTIETQNNASSSEPMSVPAGNSFQTYIEMVKPDDDIFAATTTTTSAGTNLNNTSFPEYLWSETIEDAAEYTHATNSSDIVVTTGGNYFISVNIPTSGSVTDGKVGALINVNGSVINNNHYTYSQNGFISNVNGHTQSSTNYANVLYNVPAGATIYVQTYRYGAAGTINVTPGFVGSIFIKRLDTSSNYYIASKDALSADANPASATASAWNTDHVIDTNVFTHSTNSSVIEVDEDGDYLVHFSDLIYAWTADWMGPVVEINVNGTPYPGGSCYAHTSRTSNTLRYPNCDVTTLLENLNAGDDITITYQRDTVTGTAYKFPPRITIKKMSE